MPTSLPRRRPRGTLTIQPRPSKRSLMRWPQEPGVPHCSRSCSRFTVPSLSAFCASGRSTSRRLQTTRSSFACARPALTGARGTSWPASPTPSARPALDYARRSTATRAEAWPARSKPSGAGAAGFHPGDDVFGVGVGSFAEYAVVRGRQARRQARKSLLEEAAAVPVSGLTALQAVRDHGQVEAGQNVLIIGASGGVGTFAVQIAKAFGAEVTGVCSTAKVDRFAPSVPTTSSTTPSTTSPTPKQRYDVILDIGGNRRLADLRRRAHPAAGGSSSSEARPTGGGSAARAVRSGRCCCRPSSAEARHLRRFGERRGPRRPPGTDRGRQGHAGHRPHLPARRGRRRDPPPARRARPGQAHGGCLTTRRGHATCVMASARDSQRPRHISGIAASARSPAWPRSGTARPSRSKRGTHPPEWVFHVEKR